MAEGRPEGASASFQGLRAEGEREKTNQLDNADSSSRRWMKFENVLRAFTKEAGLNHWRHEAADTYHWYELSARFVSWALKNDIHEEIQGM